jgi:hypothetical protein
VPGAASATGTGSTATANATNAAAVAEQMKVTVSALRTAEAIVVVKALFNGVVPFRHAAVWDAMS